MRVMVVYNPVSGRSMACRNAIAISERLLGIPYDVELIQTQSTSPENWLAPKLQFKPDAIVVVGGDGTLRQVASMLVGSSIPVYHASSGTENLFAKSMNTNNASPQAVVQSILNPDVIEIDTATANGEFMLLMASVGFDAAVVTDLASNRGSSITHFSYIMPCVCQLFKWNPPNMTVIVDGEEVVTNKTGWAVIANNKQYARGLNPAKNAVITDGKLDVVFLPLKGRISLLNWIRWMRRGTHLHHPSAVYVTGKQIKVTTDAPAPWQLDGDGIGDASEMELVCVPKSMSALRGRHTQ